MNCTRMQQVLDAYIDNELDEATSAEITQHLHECAACVAAKAGRDALRAQVRAHAPYFNAPTSLRDDVERFTGDELRGAKKTVSRPSWFTAGSLATIAAVVGLLAGFLIARTPEDNPLREQVVASHVASLSDTRRLVAIASSDRHAVKPWFQGKIDFAPTVRDLSNEGFVLLGARLDHVGERQAAALVYRIRNHTINVFVWRAGGEQPATPVTAITRGFAVTSWAAGGLRYSAISDVDQRDLERLARLLNSAS
jgi:anti-sigma factor RsiW